MKMTKRAQSTVISILGLAFAIGSCTKSHDAGPPSPSVLKFSVNQATYGEADGQSISLGKSLIYVDLVLSNKQPEEVGTLQFSWSGTKTTYLGGDFSIGIPEAFSAGQTKARLMLMIIDDTQIDVDDTVTFVLTGVAGNAVLSSTPSDLKFMLIITNNDVLPANTLQTDLTWSTGTGANIDAANLDLYVQYNVVYDSVSNKVTNIGDTQTMSNAQSGFETVFVIPNDVDQTYWIAIPYISGTGPVDFTMVMNGFGRNGDTFNGSYIATDVGTSMFFGPFVKSGQTFSGRSLFIPKNGKVFAVKTDHFPK